MPVQMQRTYYLRRQEYFSNYRIDFDDKKRNSQGLRTKREITARVRNCRYKNQVATWFCAGYRSRAFRAGVRFLEFCVEVRRLVANSHGESAIRVFFNKSLSHMTLFPALRNAEETCHLFGI